MIYFYYHTIEYIIQYSIAQILIVNNDLFLAICIIDKFILQCKLIRLFMLIYNKPIRMVSHIKENNKSRIFKSSKDDT
mgnify:CR=1 FL=1